MAGFYRGKTSPFYPNQATKRFYSSDGRDEPLRKVPASSFGSRPGFEPVHFVSSGSSALRAANEKENNQQKRSEQHSLGQSDFDYSSYNSQVCRPAYDRELPCRLDSWSASRNRDRDFSGSAVGSSCTDFGSTTTFMSRTEHEYTAKYEAHSSRNNNSWFSQPQRHDSFGGGNRSGLGYSHQNQPSTSRCFSSKNPAISQPEVLSHPPSLPHTTLDEKQRVIANVAAAIEVTLRDPACKTTNNEPNYNFILSRSIQACKTNPEYIYVNLKDIPTADLPKNKKVPSDGYACELRCQQVYLATGYSGSKNGARDRASEQAVRLFLRPVEVRVVERKYKYSVFNDMVVCQAHSSTPAFVPALCNPENKPTARSKGYSEPDRHKHWREFVVVENAHDAICILNNSAAYNRMKIEYKFDLLPNSYWDCKVFVQDELLGTGTGNKRISKHMAAEDALAKLRRNQEMRQQQQQAQRLFNRQKSNQEFGRFEPQLYKKNLHELVILENSNNAICIINDTAQFNKVNADYKFSVLPDQTWKCEVYLEGQFIAAGTGPKKTVKHIAANEALKTLKLTHSVVKSNIRKENSGDAISRSQIMGRSTEEAKMKIKEDNIGNQLLRKMGWKGGGLGRDGEGIAEPIRVKEQFSREGLGLDADVQVNKRELEDIIRNYASSDRQDDLRFSTELNNDERKQIHQISQKYGLRSKSYGQGKQRFLIVSRKVHKEQLIGQLLQEGQVGRYELIKPLASQ